jgi:hypothetical protein
MGLVGEDAEPIVLRVEIRKSNHPNSALTLRSHSVPLLPIYLLNLQKHISGLRY